jgi:voltage-gated potassium channel
MSIFRVQEPSAARRQLHSLQRRLGISVAVFLGLIGLSTVVFAMLDAREAPAADRFWSGLWNSMNVFSTLGDLGPLTPSGKAWAMIMMALGVSIAALALSTLTAILTGADFHLLRENRRMERTLGSLSGHAVVVGYHDVGSRLAASIARQGRSVVVIERDRTAAELAAKDGFPVVEGEGADEATLRAAGVDRAESIFVATSDPQAKLTIVLTARELAPKASIVAIARNESSVRLLHRAGATLALEPTELIVEAMVAKLERRGPASS